MLLLLLLCFVTGQGFLLDGSTPLPKAGTVLTDSLFSMLLNLLVDERNAREQLEQIVKQNQQETANINERFCYCNSNKQDVNVNNINNKTAQLEYRVDVLQQTVHSMQVINAQIELKQVLTENNSRNLEKDITGLKQLQSVSDLQTILMLQNKTTNMEIKQQQTENTLQSVLSSANARSQDFIALLNKLKISDNRTIQLQGEMTNTNNRLNLTVSKLNRRLENQMQKSYSTLNSSINNVQNTLDSAITQLAQISNRAVLSVDAVGGTVPRYGVIPFKSVYTSHGVKNLTSVRTSGKFICEDAGTYLISVFVSTGSHVPGYYNIYINAGSIAYAYTDYESYQHTSSAAIVTNLHKGDTIFIRNGPEIIVQNNGSNLSIIQIR
ncbi:unnamed protein product [Mytilus coruscus]|uniref:C1q domain-containing protein n=1 Tax=Mytilus coruscus TaxID=42192 RepID=A0A6J8AAY8_MYTCO|nr:unnamed protein product [Mytilus coruscus]